MTDPWIDDPQVQADPALEAFLRDLSVHADGSVDPAVRTATLETMLATAAQTTTARTARPSWGRRTRRVLGLTSVKLALAAGVAAATTTGGLAATGSLPAPLQEVAHDVGRQLGIGVPDAPGQQKQSDGDPDTTGRDYAPGQQKKSDGDPDTTGRDHAPGQQRDDAPGRSGDAPGQERGEDAPAVDEPEGAGDEVRRDDDAGSNRVEPDQAPPADTVPQDAGQPEQAPDPAPAQSDRSSGGAEQPSPPAVQDAPAETANQPSSAPAQQPSRPDAPAENQRPDDAGQDAPADKGGSSKRG